MVSLHIPAYNEPPELLIETIKAVEQIDYPNFEIVVIDNNTTDPAVWGPVEEYCRDRARVKFVHVAPWPGYKAGACNLALRQLHRSARRDHRPGRRRRHRAAVLPARDRAVLLRSERRLRADLRGQPRLRGQPLLHRLRRLLPGLLPGGHVVAQRARHGPVRRHDGPVPPQRARSRIGGWNEWCICEDTEASLRVLKDGWSGLYIPRCFGRGVVPPSFAGMNTQRHRWCFGAMQILRLHWRSLMPWDRSPDNHLTAAQRRDYLMASLGWFRDLLMLAFSLLLLVITGLLATQFRLRAHAAGRQPSLLPLSLIVIATICMMSTLRHWTTMSFRRALLSLVISLAVSLVIARGCIEGLARRDGVFLRTSKAGGGRTILDRAPADRGGRRAWPLALYVCAGLLAGLRAPALAADLPHRRAGHRVPVCARSRRCGTCEPRRLPRRVAGAASPTAACGAGRGRLGAAPAARPRRP